MGKNLVLFDLDGTLMDTNGVDGECFARAVLEVIGIENVNTDWGVYQESTDPAIFNELFEKAMSRPPSAGEVGNFRRHFVGLLKGSHSAKPAAFKTMAGAVQVFELLDKAGWKAGIATGAWKDSAEFKLEAGGFAFDFMASMATADDHRERAKIIEKARKDAEEVHGKAERVVYVGDGLWDLKAAALLKLPFVAVAGNATQEAEFKKRGIPLLTQFQDIAALEKAFAAAPIAIF